MFKLSNERYEEIKQKSVDILEKYNICCVPISGFEIATQMGVKVIPYSSFDVHIQELMKKKSIDGFTGINCGKYNIFYNDSKPYKRINNTIMHEIAHIVLDHLEESELAEAEANFFAKYTLAPPPLIHKLNLKSPEEIEKIFDISYEAACYAYDYYYKWLRYGERNYTAYEIRTLKLFEGGDANFI